MQLITYLKVRSSWTKMRMGKSNDGCLRRDGQETQRRGSEDGSRDWNDVSTSQGAPRTASHHQQLKEGRNGFSSEPPEHSLCWHLDVSSSLQNCERIGFCFKPPSLWWYVMAAPRKPTLPQETQVSVWGICTSASTSGDLGAHEHWLTSALSYYHWPERPHCPLSMILILRMSTRDIGSYGEDQGLLGLSTRFVWRQASESVPYRPFPPPK